LTVILDSAVSFWEAYILSAVNIYLFTVLEGNCVLNCGGLDEWLDECLVDADTKDTFGEQEEYAHFSYNLLSLC
jgi:hypothetical protein